MKKFLSLVLTLALTLSLVVVPARAVAVGPEVAVKESKTLTMEEPTLFYVGGDAKTKSDYPDYTATYAYAWTLGSGDDAYLTLSNADKQTVTLTGKATKENVSLTCTCTVTLKKTGEADITGTATQNYGVKVVDKYELGNVPTSKTLYFNGEAANKTFTIAPTLTKNGDTVSSPTFAFSSNNENVLVDNTGVVTLKEGLNTTATAEITVSASSYSPAPATKKVTVTVADRYEPKLANGANAVSVTIGNTKTLTAPTLFDNISNATVSSSNYSVAYNVAATNPAGCVTLSDKTVTGVAAGTATITATITHTATGKTYNVNYSITAEKAKLDIKLDEVENGRDDNYLYASDLKDAAVAALKAAVPSYSGNETVTSLKVSSNTVTGGKLYKENGTTAITSTDNLVDSAVRYTEFADTAGYLGDVVYTITAVIDGETYTGTLTIPVESAGNIEEDVYAYVTSDTYTSYTMPSGYKTVYYTESSVSNYTGYKSWSSKSGGGTVSSVPISKFNSSGKFTLNVVGLDDGGVAYTGTITVYLENYDIEYSGVAGETITFDQDDFDDFMEEAAEDYGWINTSKSSTAYVEFDHVTFSIPAEKTQGILYNDGEQIKSNSKAAVKECENLDKVTFAIANKSGLKEVAINFTLYADYYSSDKVTKPATKTFSGRVVVSVVSEDIKYTVPVDGSVTFKPYDFEDFYTDTYKNGTLSYVKFTELPKVADGALYATYSTLYAGTLAKTGDKFYYDSNKITDLDLDDVTFRTSLWTKTGTKVYLPFEAYGTTTKNSKTVSSTPVKGCVVITVTAAKTMNFTDVKSGDWYYDNVKNAYTMGLIEGKTATTFNPNDNMTYAEAVTLAARMNELYNTGKVTLENSKTGNWYSSYESYAISKGIISSYLGTKANTKITRRDYVEIFYNALPASAYTVKNTITKIPDLANDSTNAKIYTFYKAGILTGYANTPGKTTGSFGANDNIKRSEVATILIRMMDASTRMYFTL